MGRRILSRDRTKILITPLGFPRPQTICMNAANLSLLNAILLIAMGLTGYFTSEDPSKTALIPVVAGVLIGLCNPGVRRQNPAIAHVAVILTLIILFALIMPLMGAVRRGDTAAIGRVTIMMLSSALAMVFFVKSFIDARRARHSTPDPSVADASVAHPNLGE